MDRDTRIAWLVAHSTSTKYRGKLAGADASVPGGNPGCGDLITMHVKAAPDEPRVLEVRFEGEGCTISQGAASVLAERINRQKPTFDGVLALSYEEMIEILGKDLVMPRPTCATLALGILKAAVKTIVMNRQLRAAGHSDDEIRALRAAIMKEAPSGLVLGDAALDAPSPR